MVSPSKRVRKGSHPALRKAGSWPTPGARRRPVPLEGGKGKDRGTEMKPG